MNIFIGVDGGGTHTRVLAVDQHISCSNVSNGRASNPLSVGREEAAATITELVADSLKAFLPEVRSVTIFLGLAGIRTERDKVSFLEILTPRVNALGIPAVALHLGSDLAAAHAGAFAGGPGVIVIAGTGSAALAVNSKGESYRVGGWGWRIDDAGSGYWIACRAMRRASRAHDGRCAPTSLTPALCDSLQLSHLDELRERVHAVEFTRDRVASLAKVVLEAAEQGDEAAAEIVEESAQEIVMLADAPATKAQLGDTYDFCLVGGLGESVYYRSLVTELLKGRSPHPRLVSPTLPPVAGSVILAANAANETISRSRLCSLSALADWT